MNAGKRWWWTAGIALATAAFYLSPPERASSHVRPMTEVEQQRCIAGEGPCHFPNLLWGCVTCINRITCMDQATYDEALNDCTPWFGSPDECWQGGANDCEGIATVHTNDECEFEDTTQMPPCARQYNSFYILPGSGTCT
jgi:hypothetical protein